MASAADESYLAAPRSDSYQSASVAVNHKLSAAQSASLAGTCPAFAAAGGSGAWSCVVSAPADGAVPASPTPRVRAAGPPARAAQQRSPSLICKPETPYHCYVSKFVEFGVGIFPLGVAHIEVNANFNGLGPHCGRRLRWVAPLPPDWGDGGAGGGRSRSRCALPSPRCAR